MSRTNPRVVIPTPSTGERTLLGTPTLVVPASQTSELTVRRVRWSFVLLPLFVFGLALGVRDVARSERTLEVEGAKARRVILYELDPGHELRLPIEPGAEVFRVLMHAATVHGGSPGSLSLGLQRHVAVVHFRAKGDRGSFDETRSISAPGSVSRVTAEDPGLVVGDPVGTSVDVHGIGVGELFISLESIDGADALLVRVYHRDDLHALDAVHPGQGLDEQSRARYARRAGELDWVDLDADERAAILGSRWRKEGALSGSNDLIARAIALAPSEPRAPRARDGVGIATFSMRDDERASVVAHGPTTVVGRVEDPEAPVFATVRYEDGTVAKVDGNGEIAMKVPDGNVVGIELASTGDRSIEVRAADARRVEPPTRAAYWRASPSLAAVFEAAQTALVVRVTARRSVPRGTEGAVPIGLEVTVKNRAGAASTTQVHDERSRSRFDRYEGGDSAAAPTDKLVFYVLVPAGGSARLAPIDAPIDLSLSELDPGVGPRPVAAYAPGAKHDAVAKVGEVDWDGFVARRPSNAAAFEPDAHGLVRIAHRYVAVPPPAEKPPAFRIARPRASDAIKIQDRIFDPATVGLDFDTAGGQAITLPVHLYSADPATVIARVDGGVPRRIEAGLAARVTVDRKIEVVGERKAIVVLGDDLAPGKHTLTFEVADGKKVWLHVPWLKRAPRAREATTRRDPPAPRWVEGEFDN